MSFSSENAEADHVDYKKALDLVSFITEDEVVFI